MKASERKMASMCFAVIRGSIHLKVTMIHFAKPER